MGTGGRSPRTAENFRKFANKFLQKIAKMLHFRLFSKISREVFSRLDEKHNCLGNLEKALKVFDANSLDKLKFYLFSG